AIERGNILSARRIVYASEEEARLAQINLASLPRSVVIPLGGDAPWERAKEFAVAFREQFPKASGRRQSLFLGRLHFKKGVDRILAILPSIAAKFPDLLLTIVGDGTREFEVKLRQEIRGMGLQKYVLMTGRLQGPAKWGAYASAELFLLPS